jgi:hypothetical protein
MSPASINDTWGGGHRPATVQPVQVNAPAPTFDAGDAFETADAYTRYAARRYAETIEAVGAQGFDERGKAAVIESFGQTGAAQAVDTAIEAADAEVGRLAEEVVAERDKLAPANDTATQLAASRTWDRGKHSLEAAKGTGGASVVTAARNLVRDAKPGELAVLSEELKPWLAAEGLPTEWIDGELARQAPALAEAQAKHREAELRVLRLKHNAGVVRRAYGTHQKVNEHLLVKTD